MAGMPANVSRLIAAACACALVASCSSAPVVDPTGRVAGSVVRVVDGDTVELRIAGRTETVRLIGVNTPETKHPTKPVECFGPEASHHTEDLLPPGTRVSVSRDVESRDRYGRLLLYVVRASDDLLVNLDLVAGGWAEPYPFPPNTSLAATFALAAAEAEAKGLGLWGACPR